LLIVRTKGILHYIYHVTQLNKYSIKLIVILTSVALIGLISAQVVLFSKSYIIARQQFDHRVDQALTDIISELKDYSDNSVITFRKSNNYPSLIKYNSILDVIDTTLLDTLVKKYVDYHRLEKNYFYAIVKTSGDSVIYHSHGFKAIRLKNAHKACLSALWKKEYYHLAIYFPGERHFIIFDLSLWLLVSFVFLSAVIFGFVYTILTILRQKKLSEMKNDFINNMTHEFKTPISTIELATDVLLSAPSSSGRIQKYSRIIHDENLRMRSLVEQVLKIAMQENGELYLNKEKIDIHRLISETVNNLCLERNEKNIKVDYRMKAGRNIISADIMHIRNVITNIVENGIKYNIRDPFIIITTKNKDGGILISFEDNGIGISHDEQKRIFDQFYRVPTGDVHDVKGFGLGLFYVKTIVETHHGFIKVRSEINKGSRFDVFLPTV
jgi:two-component system, OmpR family, phosphate regulon sensor histidine kinase PhoR